MKIKDFLNTYDLLKEGYIASDYTWGFELEGICTTEQHDHMLPSYHSDAVPRGTALELKNNLDTLINRANLISQESIAKDKEQKIIYGKIGSDGSVKPSSNKGGWSFEYASGVMQFSIKGALEILKILYEELPKLNVYTNSSCGFHTHASLPFLSKEDAVWLICCISIDDKIQKELTELNKNDVKIDFYDDTYAGKSFYNDIYNGLLKSDYSTVSKIVSGINTGDNSGKYRNIRLHPEKGTFEWRGPRNFLNDNDYNLIKEYIYKFYRVLQYYSKILNAKEWSNDGILITRKEIDDNVSMTTSFDTNIEKHKKNTIEKLAEKISTNSNILLGLRPAQLVDLLNGYSYKIFITSAAKALGQLWKKLDEKTLKYILNNIDKNKVFDWLLLLEENNIEYTTYPWMYEKYKDNSLIYRLIVNNMKDFCEEIILDYPNVSNINKKNIIEYFIKNIDNIPMDFWSKLMNPKYYPLISHVEMPVKIQKKFIKKNPYNIQYIKNPDQSVINYASKQVEDIDQYIPRM